MKKILFVINTLDVGGAETGMLEIIEELKHKYEIDICLFKRRGGLLNQVPSDINVYSVINEKRSRLVNHIYQWLYFHGSTFLHKQILKKKYDAEIAFLEGSPAVFVASSPNKDSRKVASIRVDIQNHSLDTEARIKNKKTAKKILEKAYTKMDIIYGVSKDTTESFIRKFPQCQKNAKTLYTYFDKEKYVRLATEPFTYSDSSINHIVSVGRCFAQKGYDRLVRIASLLKKDGYIFQWHIVGKDDTDYGLTLKKLVDEENLNDVIVFEGEKANPYPFIAQAKMLVSTSYYEGYPRVLNEAICLEIPVIAPNISGVRESIGQNQYGLVAQDTVEDLYLCIKRILDDKELYQKLKSNLKEKKYSKDEFYQTFCNFIDG